MSEDKVARVLDFLVKSLDTLSEQLQDASKAISQFEDAIKTAKGDLSGVDVSGITSKKAKGGFFAKGSKGGTVDKQAAAQTLFNLLGGSGVAKPAVAPAASGGLFGATPASGSAAKAPGLPGGLPSAPSGLPGGLPSAPSGLPGGLPSAPSGLPGGLPSAPSVPKGPNLGLSLGSEKEAPRAGLPGGLPSGMPGLPTAPKPAGPPGLPGGAPGAPPVPGPPGMMGGGPMAVPASPGAAGGAAGGAFKSLRDEMLSELNRLKKIMGGAK